jgi:hypothetical protein
VQVAAEAVVGGVLVRRATGGHEEASLRVQHPVRLRGQTGTVGNAGTAGVVHILTLPQQLRHCLRGIRRPRTEEISFSVRREVDAGAVLGERGSHDVRCEKQRHDPCPPDAPHRLTSLSFCIDFFFRLFEGCCKMQMVSKQRILI